MTSESPSKNTSTPSGSFLEPVKDENSSKKEDVPENINDVCEILPEHSQGKSDLSFKIIVIGNSGVGKTCLALRALKGQFSPDSIPTVGFEFLNMQVKLRDKIISLQIWDTCGQEAYQSIVTKFYKRAAMAILVYSIADRNSFDNWDTWLNELRNNSNLDVKIALVGNKTDWKGEREVTKEEAWNYKLSRKLDLIFESSAKHGDNSQDIFMECAKMWFKEYANYSKKISWIPEHGGSWDKKGYERYNHPFGSNAKLPGKESITLQKREKCDEPEYDQGNGGSCPKC